MSLTHATSQATIAFPVGRAAPLPSEFAPHPTGTGGMTKVEKFKWTVKDTPGVFMAIPKEMLKVHVGDSAYQRPLVETKSTTIAQQWSWIGCGCLLVAKRGDEYYLMDGQHRHAAAMKRADILTLPCLVFEVADIKTEVNGFLDANVNRKPLTMMEKFTALKISGNKEAHAAQAFADLAGREIGKTDASGARTLQCVRQVMHVIQTDEDAFNRIAPIIIEVCHGKPLHVEIVKGLFFIERRMAKHGASLSQPMWRRRLLSVGYDDLLARSRKMKEALGLASEMAIAKGFNAAVKSKTRHSFPGFSDE